jgi:hypothetical protein
MSFSDDRLESWRHAGLYVSGSKGFARHFRGLARLWRVSAFFLDYNDVGPLLVPRSLSQRMMFFACAYLACVPMGTLAIVVRPHQFLAGLEFERPDAPHLAFEETRPVFPPARQKSGRTSYSSHRTSYSSNQICNVADQPMEETQKGRSGRMHAITQTQRRTPQGSAQCCQSAKKRAQATH